MTSIVLPEPDGTLHRYVCNASPALPTRAAPPTSRVAYAAAHVVADPLGETTQAGPATLDWDATLAFRHHLWALGLGVADAMDTAQRGMGLDWTVARELVVRSATEARAVGGAIAAGAQTDHLAPGTARTLDDVVAAYLDQCAAVEEAGATVVVMASRELCRIARGADDYAYVYDKVLGSLGSPAILHWLGDAFDPALAGYFGSRDVEQAAACLLAIVADHREKVDGVKLSLLDKEWEIVLRRQLPPGVRMYTGDDFGYPTTIAGDDKGHSDALLGAFDFAAPAAAWALAALDCGDVATFRQRLDPTLPLSRHVFCAPTGFYKTGVVFLAYLNGHQSHFTMVGGLQSARSVVHLAQCFRLADSCGLLADGDLAARRMANVLALAGIEPT
jgi:hypothetical protein